MYTELLKDSYIYIFLREMLIKVLFRPPPKKYTLDEKDPMVGYRSNDIL